MPTAEQRPEPSTKCENKAKTNKKKREAKRAKKNVFSPKFFVTDTQTPQ
jgi:hypothetical protein